MRAAIVQSSYIPWKGYFSLIQLVDDFILYDDVQYTHRDWRNRNRIRTRQGLCWLSIPVSVKGRFTQRVRDAEICEPRWARKHWTTISASYARAPFFAEVAERLAPLYEACGGESHLSAVNRRMIQEITGMLGITTRIHDSGDFELQGNRSERLAHLCRQIGARDYLTGPRAADYLDEACFHNAGMRVCWMDYSAYPEYPQLHGPPYEHQVSVIDLLMNLGPEGAAAYMAAFRDQVAPQIFPAVPDPAPAGSAAAAGT
jgi:hypothetical protein